MTRRSGSPARACLAVGLVAGLAACGGGGPVPGTDSGVAPPANEVPEMTITPPTNRGPEAVGSVPAQALTEGGAAHVVDVAERFRDPDGDALSHSAASGDPEIVTVSMSGSMAKLTPVSIGEATVTVIASDGRAEAVQAFTVTVRRREAAPPAAGRPAPSPQPETRPAPPVEPEIIPPPAETKLTGIKVQRQADRGLSVRPVPQAARLKGVGLSWGGDPRRGRADRPAGRLRGRDVVHLPLQRSRRGCGDHGPGRQSRRGQVRGELHRDLPLSPAVPAGAPAPRTG